MKNRPLKQVCFPEIFIHKVLGWKQAAPSDKMAHGLSTGINVKKKKIKVNL